MALFEFIKFLSSDPINTAMTADSENPCETLRQGLIYGRWKSGERLIRSHSRAELNCTSSVLREAMLRLAGEGLIVSEKIWVFALSPTLGGGDFHWELGLTAA